MNRKIKLRGFTLIELLIVMVILGLSSALLVPDMFSMLQRAQAKTELAKIKALATLSVEKSFFSATTIELKFEGPTLIINQKMGNEGIEKELKVIESEHFSFANSTISIVNGLWLGDNAVLLTRSPDVTLTTLQLRD